MNSLQAGLIAVSVFVIALFAAWMWWQGWRSRRSNDVRRDLPARAPAVAPQATMDTVVDTGAAARTEPKLEQSSVAYMYPPPPVETESTSGSAKRVTGSDDQADEVVEVHPAIEALATKFESITSRESLQHAATPADASAMAPKTMSPPSTLPLDERLHVYALVTARDGQAIDCPDFVELADRSLAWGRVFRLSAWEAIDDLSNGGAVQALCLSIPIASRAGPLTDSDTLEWKREVSRICDALALDVSFGGDIGVGARAQELDQFLAAADVICVLYLVRKDGGQWSGTRLRGTLEANGFRLQADGRFVYFEVESESPIFSAVDGFERSFTPERLRTENINALRLVFEASNVAQPVARFDVYRQTLRALARLLEAEIKDSSGAIVGDAEFALLRNDVQAGSVALADAGIECGSPTALALFR
jgi:hypothetical protein